MKKSNEALQVLSYNGNEITLNVGSQNFVNATQMGKPFGKEPYDFLKLKSTKSFIKKLDEYLLQENSEPKNLRFTQNSEPKNLRFASKSDTGLSLITVKGGDLSKNKQGTWMHELLAIEYAGWLSPDFKLWMNIKIRELLTTGEARIAGWNKKGSKLINEKGQPVFTHQQFRDMGFRKWGRKKYPVPDGAIWQRVTFNFSPLEIDAVILPNNGRWINFPQYLKARGCWNSDTDQYNFLDELDEYDYMKMQQLSRGLPSFFVREEALEKFNGEKFEIDWSGIDLEMLDDIMKSDKKKDIKRLYKRWRKRN